MASTKRINVHPQNRVGIRELRQEASKILARVEEGEEFMVTDRVIPVSKSPEDYYEEMVAAGEIIPPTEEFFIKVPKMKPLAGGKTGLELFLEERDSYL
jgi:antitoxin (DNA-binding transcriptional repressor) of toxin-antitoxin stability system